MDENVVEVVEQVTETVAENLPNISVDDVKKAGVIGFIAGVAVTLATQFVVKPVVRKIVSWRENRRMQNTADGENNEWFDEADNNPEV